MNRMDGHKPLILVIEDDLQTRRFLRANLSRCGWMITEADNGRLGLTQLKELQPNVVILDLGLPDISGTAMVVRLRQLSDIPILVLSARSQEHDKISALEAGADDYLTKPFSTGELNARLQALMRRAATASTGHETFVTGELTVNLVQRKVFIADCEVHLTPIEYRILSLLIRYAGLVVTHSHLLKEIWGAEHLNDNHYLRIHMGQLRHKLEANPARPKYLLTELGVGYRLAENAK